MEQRIKELEQRVTELEKQVAAATTTLPSETAESIAKEVRSRLDQELKATVRKVID